MGHLTKCVYDDNAKVFAYEGADDMGGIHTGTVRWKKAPTPENIADARRIAESLLDGHTEIDSTTTIKRLGRGWFMCVNTGPPTWFLPRITIQPFKQQRIGIGWIRGYIEIYRRKR
jgi:hypothetical protein